jgi:hypothetical protein
MPLEAPMTKKFRLLRTYPQQRNVWVIMAGVLALCLLAGCRGSTSATVAPASADTGSADANRGMCNPHNVVNTPNGVLRHVDISWAPADCAAIDHYNIIEISAKDNAGRTVQQVPANSTSGTAAGLNLCTFYRFGVQAVSKDGRKSSVILPDHFAFLSGPADQDPPVVTIVLQGINSSLQDIHNPGAVGSFNPAAADYCTSSKTNGSLPPNNDGIHWPLQSLADGWLNYPQTDPTAAGAGAGNNLLDSLASTGGYVLPFSYKGAEVSGTAAALTFTVQPYTKDDVANSTIPDEEKKLAQEIATVRKTWPNTTIIVVGHSNGGLIAEQWWLHDRSSQPGLYGVKQVFSLDSPLNGLYDAPFCSIHLCELKGVGSALGDFYSALWANQSKWDPSRVSQDSQDQVFTAVGSYGDPLYDMGDNGATILPTTDARIGIISQLYFTEPSCQRDFIDPFDLSTSRCQPTGRFFIDPCAPASKPLDIQWGPPGIPPGYGGFGDLWMHSVVKNCPGVIQKVMTYTPRPGTASATPATPSTAPQATVVKTFEPWTAPGLAVTNGGTATCDSGSADDPGSAVAVRCSPPGNGTPCYINDTGGGDPGSPLLCSSDPTSKQVIEVTPAGPNGIPAGMLNPGDPSQPPWFLVLADGRKCHFLGYGTNTNVLSYDCGNNIGATVPDRSSPMWTVQEGQLGADPAPSPARVAVVTAYRGKTSVASPAALPTPAPATPSSASAVVQNYYAAINAHDYQSAWSIGGKNLAGSYDSFVKGFANTASDSVTVTSVSGDTVMIQLDSTQTDGTHGYFTGTYTVQNDEIVSADVHAR